MPGGFSAKFDPAKGDFVLEAAYLSAAVYDDEQILANFELAAQGSGHIRIENSFNETLILVQNAEHGATRKIQLKSGEKKVINVDQRRVEWDVYQPPLVFSSSWTPPWRKWASNEPAYDGRSYQIVSDNRRSPHLRAVDSMTDFIVKHSAVKSEHGTPLQWMLAQHRPSKAFYIVFRGTYDAQDAVVDAGGTPDFETPHGVGVHSGIKSVLKYPTNDVMDKIVEELTEHRRAQEPIVLCGHSLGGGYAQAAACYLLHMGWEVTAVRTFGSLHPLAPYPEPMQHMEKHMEMARKSEATLQMLAPVMQHFVHAWDPVPRLPWCRDWFEKVFPSIKVQRGNTPQR